MIKQTPTERMIMNTSAILTEIKANIDAGMNWSDVLEAKKLEVVGPLDVTNLDNIRLGNRFIKEIAEPIIAYKNTK